MDGPAVNGGAGAGGWEVGSAYVTVSCDLAPAKQQLADFRSELQSITQGNYGVPVGTAPASGTVTPMAPPSAISSGQSGFAGIGGAMGVQQIQIDTSAAQRAVSDLKERVSELHAALATLQGNVGQYGGSTPNVVASAINSLPYQQVMTAAAGMGLGNFLAPSGVQFGHMVSGTWGNHNPNFLAAVDPMSNFAYRVIERGANRIAGFEEAGEGADFENETAAYQRYRDLQRVRAAGGFRPLRPGAQGYGLLGRNPFSAYGVAARLGAGVGTVLTGLQVVSGLNVAQEANDLESHPESILMQQDHFGSAYSPFNDDAARGDARELGYLHAVNKRQEFVQGLPLIGDIMKLGDTDRFDRQRRIQVLAKRSEAEHYLSQRAVEQGVEMFQAQGLTPQAVAAAQQIKVNEQGENFTRVQRLGFNSQTDTYQQAYSMWQQQQQIADIETRNAHLAENARRAALGSTIASSSFGVLAANYTVESVGHEQAGQVVESLKSQRAAMVARQSASIEEFNGQTSTMVGGAKNDEERARIRSVRAAQLDELKANNRAELAPVNLQIEKATLRNQGFDSPRLNVEAYEQAQEAQWAQRRFGAGMAMGQGSIAASSLAAQHDPFGATMAMLNAREQASNALPALQRGMELAQVNSARNAATVEHNFQLQVATEGYDARVSAANEQMALRPMTASADLEIAHARREIATVSDPAERSKAIAANTAELRARQKLLTAQRGGEVAVDMSMNEAMGVMSGRGVDLTGRMIDIQHARQAYEKGIGNLGNSPNAATGGDVGHAAEILTQAGQALLKAADKFLGNTLKGMGVTR